MGNERSLGDEAVGFGEGHGSDLSIWIVGATELKLCLNWEVTYSTLDSR